MMMGDLMASNKRQKRSSSSDSDLDEYTEIVRARKKSKCGFMVDGNSAYNATIVSGGDAPFRRGFMAFKAAKLEPYLKLANIENSGFLFVHGIMPGGVVISEMVDCTLYDYLDRICIFEMKNTKYVVDFSQTVRRIIGQVAGNLEYLSNRESYFGGSFKDDIYVKMNGTEDVIVKFSKVNTQGAKVGPALTRHKKVDWISFGLFLSDVVEKARKVEKTSGELHHLVEDLKGGVITSVKRLNEYPAMWEYYKRITFLECAAHILEEENHRGYPSLERELNQVMSKVIPNDWRSFVESRCKTIGLFIPQLGSSNAGRTGFVVAVRNGLAHLDHGTRHHNLVNRYYYKSKFVFELFIRRLYDDFYGDVYKAFDKSGLLKKLKKVGFTSQVSK